MVPNIIGSVAEQRYVPVILVLYACVDLFRPHEPLPLLCEALRSECLDLSNKETGQVQEHGKTVSREYVTFRGII